MRVKIRTPINILVSEKSHSHKHFGEWKITLPKTLWFEWKIALPKNAKVKERKKASTVNL